MKTVDGRNAITRKDFADKIGYSEAGARALYGKRADNGHPESAFTIGRTIYWWEDELNAWWEQQRSATRIERTGDPNELLFAQDVADLLGYEKQNGARTVLAMHSRGQFREADHIVPAGQGQKSGQPRPQWKRSTVWDYADSRTTVRRKADDGELPAATD